MPRKHSNAAPRREGAGARTQAAFFPAPLGHPKQRIDYTRAAR